MESWKDLVDHVRSHTSNLWGNGLESYGIRLDKKVLIITLTVGGMAYVCYKICKPAKIPPIPKFDFDFWWGPEELKSRQNKSIRPFRVEFSEEMVKDLQQRLSLRRKFVPPLEGVGFRYGFNSEYLEKVLDFWKNSYNFQEREQFFNQFLQYKTNIQGLDVHFIHVKPAAAQGVRVLPLLLLHGWPGSFREFYGIIPLLTTQRKGYDFVFEVIVPSLPGYGFSSAAVRPGLASAEVAVVMRNLMHRLGHSKFYVQGGDWGASIGSNLATIFPEEILGLHSNFLITNTMNDNLKLWLGSFKTSWIVEDKYKDRLYPFWTKFVNLLEESGYMHIQATKPDTVGTALSDSPAGLAAYILEKFSTWTNTNYRELADGGLTKKYELVDLLDIVMVYWSTNSITTSMRLYAESMSMRHGALQLDKISTPVPIWALKTKYELMYRPDCLLRNKFQNLLHSTVLEDGGHFAAFEMPELLADEVFKAVEAFIQFHVKNKK